MEELGIGIAGALGALTRYELGVLIAHAVPTSFPLGVLAINLTGCFLLGLLTALAERRLISHAWRLVVGVGFVGAYTTFSTWSVDTVKLYSGGHVWLAAANVAVSLALGLPAAWAGLRTAK